MAQPVVTVEVFKGAEEICGLIKESPEKIAELVRCEGLPAWKRSPGGCWYALNIDLFQWLMGQRSKYMKDSPKYAGGNGCKP